LTLQDARLYMVEGTCYTRGNKIGYDSLGGTKLTWLGEHVV